jgi:hypothetical protein
MRQFFSSSTGFRTAMCGILMFLAACGSHNRGLHDIVGPQQDCDRDMFAKNCRQQDQLAYPPLTENPSFSQFASFVTQHDGKLWDGDKPLRFIGLHATELHRIENDIEGPGHFRWPTPWEQENWIRALVSTGHTVSRIYVLSVRQGKGSATAPVHVIAPGQFNEEGFRAFDKMLQLCNQYGLRIIVPVVDNWQWWGGIADYAAFRGKGEASFYTDPAIRNDFKATLTYLLNRTNTYTGVKYKDDKAILAWETGNELRKRTKEWLGDIAAHIRQLDGNHLIADGTQTVDGTPLDEHGLNDPNVDIVSNHYYGRDLNPESILRDAAIAKNRKPFIVGEFGLPSPGRAREVLEPILQAIVKNNVAGGLVWGFRGHRREGGFYFHAEGNSGIFSYHLPGFPENDSYEELTVVNLVRNQQAQINQMEVRPLPSPETPALLPIHDPQRISWLGSSSGRAYDIIRAPSLKGPWSFVGRDISDGMNRFDYKKGLFKDTIAAAGETYYYRIRAKNESGMSEFSEPVMTGGKQAAQ